MNSVESYDPIANVWTQFCNLPTPGSGVSLCFFQNKFIFMGEFMLFFFDFTNYLSFKPTLVNASKGLLLICILPMIIFQVDLSKKASMMF
jgi:hypothetical protein